MKKQTLYLGFLLLFPSLLSAQLNGTYTIGGSSPDFVDVQAAFGALASQGINGAVLLNIRPGTYVGTYSLGEISGSSATNVVTFQAENQDSSSVVWQYTAAGVVDNNIFNLTQTDYVHFKHLSFLTATTGNYRRIGTVFGNCRGIRFENCLFTGSAAANNYDEDLLEYDYGPGIYIANCRFENGNAAVKIIGNYALPFIDNSQIINCSFYNQDENGVFGQDIRALWVEGSYFFTNTENTLECIELNRCDSTVTILGNHFELFDNGFSSTSQRAVKMGNCVSPLNTSVIANNYVYAGDGPGHVTGFSMGDCQDVNVVHNTMRSNKDMGWSVMGVSIQNSNLPNNIDVLNNNFVTPGTTAVFYGSADSIDFNNFFTETGVDNTNFLPEFGPNNFSVDPQFLGPYDGHVSPSGISDAGTPLPYVLTDFDGDSRDPLTPDIGCDEHLPFQHDAAILQYLSPMPDTAYCAGIPEVIVQIQNTGAQNLTSAQIQLFVNGNLVQTINWAGNLAYQETESINLGTFNYQPLTEYTLSTQLSALSPIIRTVN